MKYVHDGSETVAVSPLLEWFINEKALGRVFRSIRFHPDKIECEHLDPDWKWSWEPVDLPEKIFLLPTPAWVHPYGYEDPELVSTYYFASEVSEVVAGFQKKLNEILEEVA